MQLAPGHAVDIERDGMLVCAPCAEAWSVEAPQLPIVDLDDYELDPAIVALIPPGVAREYATVPLYVSGKTLTVAVARASPDVLAALHGATKLDIEPVLALREQIDAALGG